MRTLEVSPRTPRRRASGDRYDAMLDKREIEMTNGERVTGTPDEHYDLVSVLYHALQGGETSQQYIDDARKAHDAELAQFFEQVQVEDRNRAESAKRLLIERLQVAVP
jgi:hypothetical protein